MSKSFNTTGPCFPRLHYMLPPKERLVGASLERYIRDELYWVLHAPRQTGKTTFLQTWMLELNADPTNLACYVSLERCQGVPEVEKAMPALIESMKKWANTFNLKPPPPVSTDPKSLLNETLYRWAKQVAPRRLILLFDEVDVVVGPMMISFLRQLRDGFAGRGVGSFPVSVALVGMRDLRDYLVHSKEGIPLNPGSPFNIKEDSVSLGNFTSTDIITLTEQHTKETGQIFNPESLKRIFQYTSGQPWLVNALCKECVLRIAPTGRIDSITAEHIDRAKEGLILSRATHIDSLGQRLREVRVKRVVEPILIGASDPNMAVGDDFQFCLDLGLVIFDETRTPAIANAIYREILARELSFGMQSAIPSPEWVWCNPDGTLNLDELMNEFQEFWRNHSEIWEEKADYTEAFPHLLLMAFLQRVINGGGTIEREYSAGRGRLDLLLHFGGRKEAIEIKLVHPRKGREGTLAEGLKQIGRYADTIAADSLHLVIFDRRPKARTKPWEERLTREEGLTPKGRLVKVVWG